MFRPLLSLLQALWENRSKSCLYFNALWDPKCLQIVLYGCGIYKSVYIKNCGATQIPIYTKLCILQSFNLICKHFGFHNALKYR